MAALILLVGLPGAGKTTVARRLAAERAALRLTPDEWMLPLFGEPEADGKRDVLEGRLITVALRLIELRTNVVLDFGCWGIGRPGPSLSLWTFASSSARTTSG